MWECNTSNTSTARWCWKHPGAHPDLHEPTAGAPSLYGFRVLLSSGRAPVFLFVFCTCLDQAGGVRFGLGLARGFLCLLSLAWKISSLEPAGPVQTTRVQGLGLGLAQGH